MPEPNDQLLALLIAADKVSATPMKQVMEVITNYSNPIHERIHGDQSGMHLKGWRNVRNKHA